MKPASSSNDKLGPASTFRRPPASLAVKAATWASATSLTSTYSRTISGAIGILPVSIGMSVATEVPGSSSSKGPSIAAGLIATSLCLPPASSTICRAARSAKVFEAA